MTELLWSHKFVARIAFASSLFSISVSALAIGDSGGCGDSSKSPLHRAVATAGPLEIEQEIEKNLNYQEQRVKLAEKFAFKWTTAKRDEWRTTRRHQIVNGLYKDPPCQSPPLLWTAVRAGNLEVVRYLVSAKGGADPNGPLYEPNGKLWKTIFATCEEVVGDTPETRKRYLQAVSYLLSLNVTDVNMVNEYGQTALHYCLDADLLELYLAHGANPNIDTKPHNESLLIRAVLDAVTFDPDSYSAKRLHGVDRARVLAKIGMASIVGDRQELQVRSDCKRPAVLAVCRELSTFVFVSPGVFP